MSFQKTLNVKIVQGAFFYPSPIANFETVIFSDIVPIAKIFEILFTVISKDTKRQNCTGYAPPPFYHSSIVNF